MADLLALCYTQQCKARAQEVFHQAGEAMQRIKEIPCNDQAEADGFMVAHFASALEPAAKVMQVRTLGNAGCSGGWTGSGSCQAMSARRTAWHGFPHLRWCWRVS